MRLAASPNNSWLSQLHARSVVGPGLESVSLVEGPTACGSEQLDIGDTPLDRPLHEHAQKLGANPAASEAFIDDHLGHERVESAVADDAADPDEDISPARGCDEPATLERSLEGVELMIAPARPVVQRLERLRTRDVQRVRHSQASHE